MADIAVAFHWSASECEGMDIIELMEWRERARVRTQRE